MIRIYLRHADGSMEQVERVSDPTEAEAHYLRLVQTRTAGPASIIVDPKPRLPGVVEQAQYRTDRDWPAEVAREHVLERRAQLWAPASAWVGPTPFQLRAVVTASGESGSEIARRIGVTPRQWRRWLSDPDEGASRIPYAAWVAALRLTGLLPDDEHAG